jgi:FtsH-binding integral membrane protein
MLFIDTVFGASLMISVAVCNAMSLSLNARRKSPTKWFLLSLFTVCEAFTVGVITALYSSKVTLQSVLVTSMATGIISLYTILQRNPKYDLSQWGAGLLS